MLKSVQGGVVQSRHMQSHYALYIKHGCPFCEKVLAECERLGITPEIRDIADAVVADDLVERGGKRQVPYLVDINNAVEMYESDDIIAYLREQSGAGSAEESEWGA